MAFDQRADRLQAGEVVGVQRVSVTYANGVSALRDVSLTIRDREVTVLLGRSGAGKSTLLRALNLLTAPTSGVVTSAQLGPLHRAGTIRAHRRDTAIVFQQHQLIGRLTALQNVLMARLGRHSFWRTLLPFSDAERRLALACLDRVGLFEKAADRCDSLSGGQQQRVGIARALAQEPKLILADEPVASLDPSTSHTVLKRFQSICAEDGIPVVISLHQLEFARTFADRIVGLAAGRIVFDDAPDKLDAAALSAIYET